MPDGHLQRIDEQAGEAIIIRNGRRFLASLSDVERAAQVNGARVHFDIDRHDGIDGATNVRLASGTRTNKRQRRFGDLTGAKLPGAKVKSSSSSRLGVDVTTQSARVVQAWVDAMGESNFDDATSLYAPNAVLHCPNTTRSGRKAIRSTLEDEIWKPSDEGVQTTIGGFDQLVQVRVEHDGKPETEWFEVHRGAIVEHWHGITPDVVGESDDGPRISIIRSGEIDDRTEQHLRDDLRRATRHFPQPIEEVRVKVDAPPTPSHPYSISATLHSGTVHVRSHVTAMTLTEAIDDVCSRLETQIERVTDRKRRPPEQHRPDPHSWRHGDRPLPQELTDWGPTAPSREIVRHKAWGPRLSTIDEAIWDMEQADYDFFLFTEQSSHSVGLVWRAEGGPRAQLVNREPSHAASAYATMELESVPTMSIEMAQQALNERNAPFVFATTPDKDPFVLYRRYDGHYGLIEPRPLLDE